MGARQSGPSRTVSMDNNNPIGVIDVSDAVVQRLRNGLPKGGDSTKASETSSNEQHQPTTTQQSATSGSSVPSSYSIPPPVIIHGEPTITASDVRRQKEAELNQNDIYWRKRLAQLELTLNKTNAIMEKEYSAAMEDVRKRFHNAPPTRQLPPCQDLKAQLIACYRSNPGETLKCSEEVAAFTNCVSENRVKKLDQSAEDASTSTAVSASKGKDLKSK